MKDELAKLISAERKNHRELKELRDLRAKIHQNKQPDQKVIAMIDAEILKYTEQK